ncbi:MAG: hypothetical protein AB1403_03925 [Candidatus Riflebacteria bacterium]
MKSVFKKIVLIWACFFSLAAFAAPPMYTVDYKLLVGLHPKMGSYDIVLERHLRSDINFSDSNRLNELNLQIASASMQANQRIEELQRDLDRLLAEKAKVENRMTGVVEFDEELGRYDGDSSRKHQARKISEIEMDIVAVQAKIDAIWDNVMNPLYLSRQQSRKIVESVLAEIDLMLEQFSTQLGNAVIVDRDFLGSQMQADKVTSVPSVGADPLSIRLYQSLLHSDLVGDVPDAYKRDPELRKYASQMRRDIEDSFDRNISMQISKQPLYGNLPGFRGRLFLAGAQNLDITRQVLEKIFVKHAVKADIAARILAQVK